MEYGSFEKNGEIKHRVTPQIIEKQDSIGKIITQRKRRIMYLRINRINADTLNNLLPDSIAIKKIFLQELNKPDFKSNFLKIIYPNQQEKQMFTEEEMMTIASKFFLVEKKDEKRLIYRVCSGKNGQIDNSETDYILLETIVFDAIYDRMLNKEMPKPVFLDSVKTYFANSVNKNKTINSIDSLETITRQSLFESMEKDENLKRTILEFYEKNKTNVPIIITTKK